MTYAGNLIFVAAVAALLTAAQPALADSIDFGAVPILLLYGGQDATVPPAKNCELFAEKFKAAGGKIDVHPRGLYGHHPHGEDPNKTSSIVSFFESK